jgi:hypothetical protein
MANPPLPSLTTAFSDLREPTLDDLYRDPILQAVLVRDGLDLAALKAVVANAQRRLAA